MKNVTVVGLGSMGSVLVELLLKQGYGVTVWNRTTSKAGPLVDKGAILCHNITEAITASEVVIVCVANYESARHFLRTEDVQKALSGRTLVQLSTGTPQDATEESVWAQANDIGYLDGAIMVTPEQMGTSEAFMLVAGEEVLFQKVQALLQVFAPHTVFTGSRISAAAALDLAFLSYFFSALIGFSHAAHICNVEGLDVNHFGSMVEQWSPAIGSIMKASGERIAGNHYLDAQSSLQTCYLSMELIARQAKEANLPTAFPDFATALFKKGMDAGLAREDGTAIYKVLANSW